MADKQMRRSVFGARVRNLIPGDRVVNGPATAVYVAQAEHPLWPNLRLVVWLLPNGSWSHDALAPEQVVGEVLPATRAERHAQLRRALLHPSQW